MALQLPRALGITAFVVAFLAGAPAAPALADAAPPLTPPASSIAAGAPTRIQMWSEVVVLDARGLASEDGVVSVRTRFRMRNTGSMPEQLRVRFPLEHPEGFGDGYGSYPIVENLLAYVDSQPVQTEEVSQPTYWTQLDEEIRWATFDVLFPVGRDVIISVEYTVHPATDEFGTRLDYVMETGSGWAGSIERAEIIVRLPYPATPGAYIGSRRSNVWTNCVFSGDTIRWVRWHIEPTQEDNFEALLVPPHLWHQILTLQRRIANGIGSEDDYMAQAEAYWIASRSYHGWISHPHLLAAAEAVIRRALLRFPGNQNLVAEGAFFRLESVFGTSPFAGQALSPSEEAQIEVARCQIARALHSGSASEIVQTAAAIHGIGRPNTECSGISNP